MRHNRIIAVETANPDFCIHQNQAIEFVRSRSALSKVSVKWYERFLKDPGIETRYFGMSHLSQINEESPDQANQRFQKVAVQIGTQALSKALTAAGLAPKDLDGLVITTCTGYLCPGLTSYISESVGLRPDIFALDMAGTGCGAALPALRAGDQFLKANPESFVAVLCIEVCSAALDWGDEIDLILSNAIFADGAACAILTNHPARNGLEIKGFESVLWPEYREHLRFRTRNSRLSNVIHPEVPKIAAKAVKQLMDNFREREEGAFKHFAVHPGGRKVLDEIENATPEMRGKLECSRAVLKKYGNMSSPSVLFVLKEMFGGKIPQSGEPILLFAFGAGFTAFGVALQAAAIKTTEEVCDRSL